MNKRLKRGLIYIAFAALLYFVVMYFNTVVNVCTSALSVLTPFVYGFIIAYILKFPYNFFYKKAYKKIGTKRPVFLAVRKPLAIVTTYFLGILIIVFLLGIMIPSLIDSFAELARSISQYVRSFEDAVQKFVDWANATLGLSISLGDGMFNMVNKFAGMISGGDIGEIIKNISTTVFPEIFSAAKVVSYGAYNWIIGIVASIYFLANKEVMCSQVRRLTQAYAPKKWQNKIFEVTKMSNEVCGNFIMGRVIDSLIMGILCYIVLVTFRFDYALLISVFVGVTNVIPFFGPFLGAIPSGFILLMIDPTECLWFVLIIITLQQIDGNIIGPKIIGDKIGISGFWILFSIIVGSGLFGVFGMILGVPVFAIIYNLLGKDVNKKLLKTKEYISKEPLNKEEQGNKG
ncbi:MAG: AI-2E family transporter [Oscillospiraceae bacterium]|nr:AI-2E family transporter [Oscillospiraceae bacterium]